MGSKETQRIPKHACTGRLVIVALSAQPPGVNELCVCVCVCIETSLNRLLTHERCFTSWVKRHLTTTPSISPERSSSQAG
jgi:hypothetical protein